MLIIKMVSQNIIDNYQKNKYILPIIYEKM